MSKARDLSAVVSSADIADYVKSADTFGARITNNSDSSQGLQVRTSDNDTGQFILDLQSSTSATGTNYGSHFVVDKSGKCGIGTTAPLRQLHIENTSANSEIAFTAGTSGVSSLLFGDGQTGTDVYRGYLQYDHSTDKMLFGTSANERMTINFQGLITSSPTANNTTGSSANMVVTSGGEFAKSTSSQRYKNTINDATHGLTELLNLRSVTFKGNNDGDTIFGGLIAEEVHDAGLTEFVVYDDQNRPDALHYGSMVSLCVKAIQELKTELDNAKARITALEGE